MNYRLATILARQAVSSDGTKVIDLNLADPVSRFEICYGCTSTGSGNVEHHAAKCVTKIELVDGSDVLYSLTGQEAQAADFYHNRKEPQNQIKYLNAMEAEMVFNLNFGRFLYDPLFSFDPRKFTNPQLKITIDLNGGGFGSTGGYLTVVAHIFDGKSVTPEGFLMHKEVVNYGLGSASHEYIDLPTDYPFRKMFIAAHTEGVGVQSLIDTIKLSEDNDRKIPFNLTANELLRSIAALCPIYRESIIFAAGATSNYVYCTPTHNIKAVGGSWEVSNIATIVTVHSPDGGKVRVLGNDTMTNLCLSIDGYAPHGAMEIPFGLQGEPEDWYDVTKLGSLRLDILSITGRSSSDTVQVFLQQLRKYAA